MDLIMHAVAVSGPTNARTLAAKTTIVTGSTSDFARSLAEGGQT